MRQRGRLLHGRLRSRHRTPAIAGDASADIRTTKLLERLFVEERRRLKIIPDAFGERAVLKLMFGALIRAAERWKSIKVSEFGAEEQRSSSRWRADSCSASSEVGFEGLIALASSRDGRFEL